MAVPIDLTKEQIDDHSLQGARSLGAVERLFLGSSVPSAYAQSNTSPPTTATRPTAPDQTSIPNNAPPASTTQTTGQASQDPKIKEMNEKEKGKVERQGK